ncbi:hypothetical protein [Sulfurimonas sp. NWX79]|uniref:hypothetical protein n=1 Tax=Sulfurimonas sp. NWX79 TaxID=2925412 RepID=UPI003204DA5F
MLILVLFGMMLVYEYKYNMLLSGIVLIGFIVIVVNSNKYPKINNFIETVF